MDELIIWSTFLYSCLDIMKSMVISQLIRRNERQVITFKSEPYFEFCIYLYIFNTSIIILSGTGCCMYFYLEHFQNMGSVSALIFLFVIIRTIRFESLNFGFHSKPYQVVPIFGSDSIKVAHTSFTTNINRYPFSLFTMPRVRGVLFAFSRSGASGSCFIYITNLDINITNGGKVGEFITSIFHDKCC